MISFNNLGNIGRLGNQMFQYASLKGIARNRNFDYCVAPLHLFGTRDLNVKNSLTNIYNCFSNFNPKQDITNFKQFEEKQFHFDKELFENCEDQVDLVGYFQSEKYFKHIENEIKEDFKFSNSVLEECKGLLKSLHQSDEWISLHVRRSDYLNLQDNHPITSLEYYFDCLNSLNPDIPVVVFSDDPAWCYSQEIFKSDRFFISDKSSDVYDLCVMTLCDYHIIANSSFSWWGAWLSNSKKVFAPKQWFGKNYKNYILDDLYCDGWIIV
jgi:hypothetical protein